MFSFQALLSTALSGSYSQGLIHRKSTKRLFQGAMKAPLSGRVMTEKPQEGSDRAIVRERNRG
jgi:hypothetical protein